MAETYHPTPVGVKEKNMGLKINYVGGQLNAAENQIQGDIHCSCGARFKTAAEWEHHLASDAIAHPDMSAQAHDGTAPSNVVVDIQY